MELWELCGVVSECGVSGVLVIQMFEVQIGLVVLGGGCSSTHGPGRVPQKKEAGGAGSDGPPACMGVWEGWVVQQDRRQHGYLRMRAYCRFPTSHIAYMGHHWATKFGRSIPRASKNKWAIEKGGNPALRKTRLLTICWVHRFYACRK